MGVRHSQRAHRALAARALSAAASTSSGNDGSVYSLDAATGCTFWATTTPKAVRSGMLVGKSGSVEAVFFGEADGSVYALDANTGSFLWSTRADTHPAATITGTPSYHDGRIYVPVSSGEEQARRRADYECCTFRGSVVAMDAATGRKILWQTYMAPDTPVAARQNRRRPQRLSRLQAWRSGPRRQLTSRKMRIYVGTGDNYSEPGDRHERRGRSARPRKPASSSGRAQFDKDDIYKMECGDSSRREGCEPPTSPRIRSRRVADSRRAAVGATHKRVRSVLILGQKSGPHLRRRSRRAAASCSGTRAQARAACSAGCSGARPRTARTSTSPSPISPSAEAARPIPRRAAASSAYRVGDGALLWKTPPPGCGDRRPCSPAQSQAVSAIPGAVFSGSIDGHLRAYATSDGKIIWDFDTAQSFDSVNKVPAKGGSLDVGGPVIAGGMIFVVSGYPGFGAMPGNALLAFSAN